MHTNDINKVSEQLIVCYFNAVREYSIAGAIAHYFHRTGFNRLSLTRYTDIVCHDSSIEAAFFVLAM